MLIYAITEGRDSVDRPSCALLSISDLPHFLMSSCPDQFYAPHKAGPELDLTAYTIIDIFFKRRGHADEYDGASNAVCYAFILVDLCPRVGVKPSRSWETRDGTGQSCSSILRKYASALPDAKIFIDVLFSPSQKHSRIPRKPRPSSPWRSIHLRMVALDRFRKLLPGG